jgi:hypothetical protein
MQIRGEGGCLERIDHSGMNYITAKTDEEK